MFILQMIETEVVSLLTAVMSVTIKQHQGLLAISLYFPISNYLTNRSKAILLWWFLLFYVLVFKLFVLLAPYVCYHILVRFYFS